MYIPYPFQLLVSTYHQSEILFAISYTDDFMDSGSNSNVAQMAEALTTYIYTSNIGTCKDERGLTISAPRFTITLEFAQSSTHPPIILNNYLLPLEWTSRILGVTFDPHFTFKGHVDSIVTLASSRINILKALAGTNRG